MSLVSELDALTSDLGPVLSSFLAEFLSQIFSRTLPPQIVSLGDKEINKNRGPSRKEDSEVEKWR